MKNILLIIILIYKCLNVTIAQECPNKIDSIGHKQGLWREYKVPAIDITMEINILIDSGSYDIMDIFPLTVCEGKYEDGLKTGIWLEYHANRQLKSKIEYINGIPNGKCQMFWPNGFMKMECEIPTEGNFPIVIYNEDGTLLSKQEGIREEVIISIYEN